MEIFSAMVPSDDGKVYTCDVVEYGNTFWLVSEWIENTATGKRQPVRIILLENLEHQKTSGKFADFVVNEPVPRCVFDGQVPQGTKFVVLENSSLEVPFQGKPNIH